MGGRRHQHDVLHELGHALARGVSAGQHLQGQQRDDHQQAHLRHRARDRAEKDAHRGGGEQMQRHPQDEQPDRTFDGHFEHPLHDEDERRRRHHDHHQAHGPHLGHHDFERGQRHDQEMFDGAVLALADQRRAGQDDRQHGDAVDELHHRAEPHRAQIRIEEDAHFEVGGQGGDCTMALHEGRYLAIDDVLHIAVADESLRHAGGVDVELDRRLAPGQHVALEIGRDVEDEGVEAHIHAGVDGVLIDDRRHLEMGRIEGVDDARR